MWNRMKLGTKFMLGMIVVGTVVTSGGVWNVYQLGQVNTVRMLEDQAKLVATQSETTRRYIARHYVQKVQGTRGDRRLIATMDHVGNPRAIPLPETAARQITEESSKSGLFSARLVSAVPLNPASVAVDAFETEALEAIMSGADSFARIEESNEIRTYRRATPDIARDETCISCHVGKQVGDVLGVLSVSIPMTEVHAASMLAIQRTSLAFVAVLFATILTISYMLRLFILKPLSDMMAVSREITQGGDLTKRVPVTGQDELNEHASGLNVFIEKLQGMIGRVAHVTDRVATASVQLSSTAEQMAKRSNGLTARTTQTATSVEEMNATVAEVAKNSGRAAAIAQDAVLTAKGGRKVVEETIAGMRHISDAVTQSATIIAALGKSSDEIGEIVRVIKDIAEQTNLLALNAAIEAARAGEQGRGFAVVADEVRKLAERTAKATQEIGDMIRQIQKDTKGAVASMEEGTQRVVSGVTLANKTGEALATIADRVSETADMIEHIAVAAEQQSVATQEIAADLENVARVSKESAGGAGESARASHDLSVLAAELQNVVSNFKVGSSTRLSRS